MNVPKMEEGILELWDREKIFEKSISGREGAKRYSFYDGPPFATGTPHYGHIVASVMKDVVPRYWTMRGFQVERKWGWDCHGLPIENIAEKALGITRKKDIEAMGVQKFNDFCRSTVLQYVDEWKKVIRRVGRWADMEHSYKTMDRDFMESVWWVFKELWDRGLIYESYRSMHICPRCETTLSQSEVAEGYKDVKDLSVVAKFEIKGQGTGNNEQRMGAEGKTYLLAWTTTPWTLPGNVALAIHRDTVYCEIKNEKLKMKNEEEYSKIKQGEISILAKDRLEVLGDETYEVVREFKGSELLGKSYKPLFDCYSKDEKLPNRENGWKIYDAEFVNTEEGTGIVHIAPAFGEDDMNLGREKNLPFVQHVNMDGTIREEVGEELGGLSVKPSENPQTTDVEIIKNLAKKNLLFSKEKYEHSYPHCWRCDTPLLNYATSSWFVKVSAIKETALEIAKDIEWVPTHIKEGRFGKWLLGARDWSISRQRYWASVMPIWKCEGKEQGTMNNEQGAGCGEMRVFGSAKDLEKASGKEVSDLHKHIVDEVTVPCEKCGGVMRRVPDVLDTWFDSGSMPYAQAHYPFENAEKFDAGFPAQFIAEGIDQTRAWFYYLHIIATALKRKPAFQHVIVNGIVLAEDGKKMSKKLKNYPDPMLLFDKYGADVVRLYLLGSPVVAAENLNFSEKEIAELQRNVFRMLWNSYSFFTLYANVDKWEPNNNEQRTKNKEQVSVNLLDRWIVSELQLLTKEVNTAMEAYELNRAARAFAPFIDHLSNWYIRRSRKRFWKNENDSDKNVAYQTLYDVLVTLSKLMAPFTPFIAEEMYRNLSPSLPSRVRDTSPRAGEEEQRMPAPLPEGSSSNFVFKVRGEGREDFVSVHLADFPVADESLIDEKLNEEMRKARETVRKGLQRRADDGIKVRQPLQVLSIKYDVLEDLLDIIKEEVNVKNIVVNKEQESNIVLDTNITPELRLEGEAREIIRAIQEGRKKAGFNVEDRIALGYSGKENVFEMFGDMIAREVLATEVKKGDIAGVEYREEATLEGESFIFWLKRVYEIKT